MTLASRKIPCRRRKAVSTGYPFTRRHLHGIVKVRIGGGRSGLYLDAGGPNFRNVTAHTGFTFHEPSMSVQGRPIATWAIPAVVLAVLLAFLASDAGTVATGLRGILFDAYQHAQPRAYQDTKARSGFAVRTLDADAASLARFGAWPWPHAVLAKLVRDLKAQHAAMVVFAFPLETPDPASPKSLLSQLPAGAAYDAVRTTLSQMIGPDDELAASMSTLATISGFTLGAQGARRPVVRAPLQFAGSKDPFGHVPQFALAAGAVAPVERTSLGIGALNLRFDADGKVRRMPLAFRLI